MNEEISNQPNEATPVSNQPVVTQNSLIKDLSIPLAIIIAGALVGAGLFFSGQTNSPVVSDTSLTPQPNTPPPSVDVLIPQLVTETGISVEAFQTCFENNETADLVQEDMDNAVATGGGGTPWSIVIGPSGKTYPLNGAVPISEVLRVVELARSEAGQGPTGAETDNVTPVTDADHVKGSLDASVKIVEYSDYDCPFCGRFHDTMGAVIAEDSDVAWVYRHLPLAQLHPNAPAVARAAECVAEQGGDEAFWQFTDGYFAATS